MADKLQSETPEMLTVEEFRAAMRLSKSTAYKMVNSGAVETVRYGRVFRIPRRVLDALVGRENLGAAIDRREMPKKPRGRPFKPGEGGRPKGAVNHASREIKSWARGMLEDPDYRAALTKRLKAGTAPTVEALLYHYGYGKPKEQVEISSGLAPLIVEVTGLAPAGDE